jgi:hypothetical protein
VLLMGDIKIGVVGVVTNGGHPGMRIRIEDDSENTGGYLIYQWWEGSDGPNAQGAFDDWVETADDLRKFLGEEGWVIEWH